MKDNCFKVRIIGSFVLFFFFNNLINAQTKIFWASQDVNKIICINSDKTGKFDVISTDLANPVGLAIDTLNDKIYWSDFGTDKIERANLDGSSRETVISGLTSVLGIALDLENNKIFWAGGNDQAILKADLDGSNIDTLVKGLEHPIGIALDVANNKIYWTDNSVIQTSDLNGQNVSELDVAAIQPKGIAIDHLNEKIYWIESYILTAQIRRSNLDGSDEETVLLGDFNGSTAYDLKHPAWIALDVINEIIYWTDAYAVISVDFNGENKETIYNDGQDWPGGGVAIYHGTFTVFRADFTSDITSGDVPLTVQFTDNSIGDITDWLWDFGDGGTSTEQNPSQTYEVPGDYTVTLLVSNDTDSDTLIKQNYITVSGTAISADFSATPTDGSAPLTVQFTDNSTGNVSSWLWDFGDESTSSEQNPSHIFETPGEYSVSLIVSNDTDSDTLTKQNYISVSTPSITADFTAIPTEGSAPLTVQFTDNSTGNVSAWLWDFGDESTSTAQNPSRIYEIPGDYTVSLIVSNEYSSDTLLKQDYISVSVPITNADFSFEIIKETVPVTVNFTDSSTGLLTSWLWEFGDGNTSTEQNPSHSYQNPKDFYSVTLSVFSAHDNDNIQKEVYGGVLWERSTLDFMASGVDIMDGGVFGGYPAIGWDETIYYTTTNGPRLLLAIDPDGTLKWKFDAFNKGIGSSPSIDKNGTIYVCSYDSCLYAINPDSTLKWKLKFNLSKHCSQSPAIGDDGTIYIGGYSSFGDETENYLYAINPNGSLIWTYKFNEGGDSFTGTPIVDSEGTIYIISAPFFYAFNPDGTVKWKDYFPGDYSPAIGKDGTIYLSGYCELIAYNPDGTVKWSYQDELFEDVIGPPVVGNNETIYTTTPDGLYAFNPDGTVKWKTTVDCDIGYTPTVSMDETIYILGPKNTPEVHDHILYAFDAVGKQKWTLVDNIYLYSFSTAPIISSDGIVYVSFENKIYSIATDNGGLARSSWPCFQGNAFNTGTVNPTTNVINTELITDNELKCYPNPFSEQITIEFEIEITGHTILEIFNLQGSKINTLVSEKRSPGKHEVIWNGTNQSDNRLSPGLYLIKLISNNKIQSNIILLE